MTFYNWYPPPKKAFFFGGGVKILIFSPEFLVFEQKKFFGTSFELVGPLASIVGYTRPL